LTFFPPNIAQAAFADEKRIIETGEPVWESSNEKTAEGMPEKWFLPPSFLLETTWEDSWNIWNIAGYHRN
jgi:hypothetical protein